jgi:hypothetical protein
MTTALKSLCRLVLAGALVLIAFSVQPTSAQSYPYCECADNNYCVQAHGTGWFCIPGGCIAQGSATGLCKKCKPDPNVICPAIYDPVTCSNGKTYSNQCFADADCATGCVPAGGV